jgi:glycogen operon protein
MVAFRQAHPVLSQETFLLGESTEDDRIELAWHQPDGRLMDEGLWRQEELRVLGMFVDHSARAAFIEEENIGPLFIVLNAGDGLDFNLPPHNGVTNWVRVVDTAREDAFAPEPVEGEAASIAPASVCVFAPA